MVKQVRVDPTYISKVERDAFAAPAEDRGMPAQTADLRHAAKPASALQGVEACGGIVNMKSRIEYPTQKACLNGNFAYGE